MADNLNQKSIYVETDYDNIILIDPNKIVVDSKVKDRLVDHEDLVFYANLETRVIPRTKLAVGTSFDSPVINSTIASLKGGSDGTTINFLQPLKSNPTPLSKTKKFFDSTWSDQLTGSGAREGKGFNQTSETTQNRDGKTVYKRSVSNYEDTQTLGIKDITVDISGLGYATVKINLVDVQGRTLFEQGENSIYSVFFNLPYPLFYLTLKGYYGKAIRYALNLTKFNASFDQRTGNYDISLSFIGRTTGLLTDTLLTYAKTAPKMTPTTYQVQSTTSTQPGANISNTQTVESSVGEQTLKEVYKIYKSKGLIEDDFPELTIDQFIQETDDFVTSMQEQIEKGDFAALADVTKFREILLDVKDKVYNVTKNSFLDLNNYFFYKGEIYYTFKETVDYTKRDEIVKSIQTEINEAVKNLKQNKSFGDNASYVIGAKNIKESIVVKLNPNGITDKFPISNLSDDDFKKTLEKRLGRTATTDEVVKFKLQTLQNIALFSKKLDSDGNLVDDQPTFFKFGETESGGKLFAGGFLFEIDEALKKLKIREEQIEKQFTEDLAKKITDKKGGLGFNPTIRNVFAILMAGVDTFYRIMDKTHTAAWNQRDNPKRLQTIIPSDKNFGIDSKNVVNGKLKDVNIVYPWPTYFTKEKDQDDKSGREKYTLNYVGDPKYSNFTNAYDYTTWPEVAFLEDYINAQTKRGQSAKKNSYKNEKGETPFGSCNTLEFPFETQPYQNISEVNFFYEIFERLYVLTNYTNLFRGNFSSFQVDKFLSDLEAKNIITGSEDSISLKEKLQNSKFNLQNLKDYLKNISAGFYASLERDLYVTNDLNDLVKKDYGIYATSTIDAGSISLNNTVPLIGNFDKYLKSSENNQTNFLDTWPCNEKLDATDKVMFFLDDKKTIARLGESPVQKNISLLIPEAKQQYGNQNLKILTRDNLTDILDLNSLNNFYSVDEKKYFVTEKKLEYDSNYSGNVSNIQSSSYLNTPYFINALQIGVEKEKQGEKNPYVALGYVFINSLPLTELGEPNLIDYETGDSLCLFYDTIRKYSAIHKIPYGYLLKLGSFWHRYKTYEEKNVDVVDDAFFNFVYDFHYDPTSRDLSKEYKIKNYDGNETTYLAYQQDPTTNTEIYNYGFYPNLVNDFHYYFTNQTLFDDFSQTSVLNGFDKNGDKGILKMGTNTSASFQMALSGDPNNLNRKILNSSYFQYLIFDKNQKIDKNNKVYMLVPSSGGIPLNQSNYECFDSNKNLKLEVKNNNAIYNGSVRSVWGAPQLGYFDYGSVTTPTHNKEIIDVTKNNSVYEIFAIFKKEMLDDFETLFLEFCDPNPTSANTTIIQKETTVEKVKNAEIKQLKYVLKDLFTVKESEVTLTGQQNNDAEILGQKQIFNLTNTIKEFLSYDLILKVGNSGEFDRKLFGSFTNNPALKPLDPIKPSGNGYNNGPRLPHEGSNYDLTLSYTQSPEAKETWDTLKVYVGYYIGYRSNYPELSYLEYNSTGSTVTDFFVDLDIEFNVENVKNFAKLIKIYATQKGKKKLAGQPYGKTEFISDLETFLLGRNKILDNSVVEVFSYLNGNLPTVVSANKNTKSTLDGNITKLSLYNTFQAFNDKWIAGSDLTTRTIFEDFLFHDTANHDIGDELQVDILKVKNILKDTRPETDILLVIGDILKAAGDLLFFSMPAYINFYGVNNPTKKPNAQNLDLPNSLFGTWANVNYLDSRPKFICVYVGKEAERPDMKNNEFVLYADDSFDLRNPTTNPIRIETDKQNISLSNKVVAFNVDFGIRNQNMFTSINVSMNDKKPTNATFLVNDQLANGVNGDKIAQQTTSLYSLYKSMSYACTVTSMGNVMIQPLMYFNLRHVPLFYGPYYIFKVKHTISADKFETTFDGSRMPKYALPKADSLATFIQTNYLENFKSDIIKKGSKSVVDENAPTILDPENAAKQESNALPSDQQCKLAANEKYNTLPYVDIVRVEKSEAEIVSLINTNFPANKTLKRFIYSLIITRDVNLFNGGKFQILNNNPFGISATNEWPTNTDLKNLVCFDNGYGSTPLFSFDSIEQSLNIIKNYYNTFIPMFNELNRLNRGINETELEAERKTIAQIIYTTWDTLLAFGPPAKTANQIIQVTKLNLEQERFPTEAYEQYLLVAQAAQLSFP
jgi:hypothetical protein